MQLDANLRLIETSHGMVAVRTSPGTGMPVILLHGNSNSSLIFRKQLEGPLGAEYRMIAFDLLGHGRSSNALDPEKTYNMPGQASAMVEALGRLGAERAAVFGWSLGGHIGLEMIASFAGMLGLMITGTSPVSGDQIPLGYTATPTRALSGKEALTDAEVVTYARATCGESQEPFILELIRRTDGRSRKLGREKFAAGFGGQQSAIVASTPIPIALVNGANEPFVNLDYLHRIPIRNLWEGRPHIVPGACHAPFWEAPMKFDEIFGRFLGDLAKV